MVNDKWLRGRVALVTGAGAGVGRELALALGRAGVRVGVIDLNPDRCAQLVTALEDVDGTALALADDVSNKFRCVSIVEKARQQFGRIDMLFCAHATPPTPRDFLRLDEWDWNRVDEYNLKGTFFITQLVARVMAEENGDRGSLIGLLERPLDEEALRNPAYAMSQTALHGYANAIEQALLPHGIAVRRFSAETDVIQLCRATLGTTA